MGEDLGTIEPGKLADLIVVAADPLDDITNLRRLLLSSSRRGVSSPTSAARRDRKLPSTRAVLHVRGSGPSARITSAAMSLPRSRMTLIAVSALAAAGQPKYPRVVARRSREIGGRLRDRAPAKIHPGGGSVRISERSTSSGRAASTMAVSSSPECHSDSGGDFGAAEARADSPWRCWRRDRARSRRRPLAASFPARGRAAPRAWRRDDRDPPGS